MIDKALIEYVKVAHGLFNSALMLAILYQGWSGLTIRRRRKTGVAPEFVIIKRHRKTGPLLAYWGYWDFWPGRHSSISIEGIYLSTPYISSWAHSSRSV